MLSGGVGQKQRRTLGQVLRLRRYLKAAPRLPNLLGAALGRARVRNVFTGVPSALKWAAYAARLTSPRKRRRRSYLRGL
jgi:hypothetical protein